MDGLLLEVVAEGEVPEHLEEGAVTRGLAHLLDVEGAHALLVAGHAVAWRGLLPMRYGMNGTMPAMVNNVVGLGETSDADGTTR